MGFTRLSASKPTIAAIAGFCLAGGPGDSAVVRSADRHRGLEARLPRAPLGSAADRRRHSAAAAHRRHGTRPRPDPDGSHHRRRRGALDGPCHRGRARGSAPGAGAGAGRGARSLSPAHDARRPAGGDRGLRDAAGRRARARGRGRPWSIRGRSTRCSSASPPARVAAARAPEPDDTGLLRRGRLCSRWPTSSPEQPASSDAIGRGAAGKTPGQGVRAGPRELAWGASTI